MKQIDVASRPRAGHWTGLWRAGSWLVLIVALMLVLPQPSPQAAQPPAAAPASAPAAGEPAAAGAQEIPFSNPLALMRLGGVAMWPIAACSIVMAAFFFERLIALRRSRIIPRPFVKRILPQIRDRELDQQEALELCAENGSPMAEIFAGALAKWGRPAVEVEQAVVDAGERATFGLRKNLRVFSAIYTLGPLLGLVGTVFGIIQAFNSLALKAEADRAQQLANGIAQSLLATAFGLIVAIPALLCYLWFLSKADQMTFEMDARAQELVKLVSAEGLHVKPAAEARPLKARRAARPETPSNPAG